jgi:tetratricopeptide (TPR) repeat protein
VNITPSGEGHCLSEETDVACGTKVGYHKLKRCGAWIWSPFGEPLMKSLSFMPLSLVVGLVLLSGAVLVQAAPDPDTDIKDLLALNDITGDDPIKGKIEQLLAKPADTKKLLTRAIIAAKQKDQPFNYNALYILARTATGVKEYDQAITFYKRARDKAEELKSGSKLGQTYGGLIDLYYAQKKFDESEKLCKEFIDIESEDETLLRYQILMQRRMIQAIAKQEKYDEALKIVDGLLRRNPDNWFTLELKGWVEREAGRHEKAMKTLEDVLDRINNDKSLKDEEKKLFGADIRYSLSNVYLELKKIDKVAEQLEELMKVEPDNPTWYNDLGYIWADHDQKFDKAEEYIRKALDLDAKARAKKKADGKLAPEDDHDSAAYLDSLGWVLFKKKDYKEAVKYLEQSVMYEEGKHIEIYDHLGDALMALGKRTEAIEAWKKGLEVAGDNKREKERKVIVEKKLKDNK